MALSQFPKVIYGTKMNDARTPKMKPPIWEKLSMYGRVPIAVEKNATNNSKSI